jgi:hypothetical protein
MQLKLNAHENWNEYKECSYIHAHSKVVRMWENARRQIPKLLSEKNN